MLASATAVPNFPRYFSRSFFISLNSALKLACFLILQNKMLNGARFFDDAHGAHP